MTAAGMTGIENGQGRKNGYARRGLPAGGGVFAPYFRNHLDGAKSLWYTHAMIANAAIYMALLASMTLAWTAPGWWR